jgi:hypothetical protein
MAYLLSFDRLHLYDSGKSGITFPVTLRLGKFEAYIQAKLDTGSSHCIFQRVFGDELGLDVESGYQIEVHTTMGAFSVYGHNVTLIVLDFTFDSLVYFAKDEDFTRDVLGRQGFLNNVQIGIRDYQGELYLSRNDT